MKNVYYVKFDIITYETHYKDNYDWERKQVTYPSGRLVFADSKEDAIEKATKDFVYVELKEIREYKEISREAL